MGLPKGRTNNLHGRKKGVPNKATADLRKWINNLLDNNREQVIKDLKALKPEQRLLFLERLIKYIIPAKSSTDVNIDVDSMTDEQAAKIADLLAQKLK